MELTGVLGGLGVVELILFSFIGVNMAICGAFLLQCGAKRLTIDDK